MKIILLHNAKAGSGDQPGADQLIDELKTQGHSVTYQSTIEKGAKWVLLEQADLVIAAGGDGTVRKAILGVAGRNIPLAIFPLGTANNLAKTLGACAPISTIVQGLPDASRVHLNLGMSRGPWGRKPFVESTGLGLLARLMLLLDQERRETAPSVDESIQCLRELLSHCPSHAWSAVIDGQRNVAGDFLLMEAMNIRSVGPNLNLAPEADPGNGFLDFVFLREEARETFLRYLKNPDSGPPPVEIVRGRFLHLHMPRPVPVHVDDFTWSPETNENPHGQPAPDASLLAAIRITTEPVEILIPPGCGSPSRNWENTG